MAAYYHFAMRTDKEFVLVKSFVESIPDTTGFAVREVAGENEHWHWYLRTPKKIHAFRLALTKKVPGLTGNGAYSVKACTEPEGYWRYMMKGEAVEVPAEVVWSLGVEWTQEKLDSLHEAYWEENSRRKKRSAGSVQDHVVDEAKRRAVQWDDRKELTKLYIKELVARAKPINTFAVKSSINVVQCLLCPNDDAVESLVNQCLI